MIKPDIKAILKSIPKLNRKKTLIPAVILIGAILPGYYMYSYFFSEDYEYVVKFDQQKESKKMAECSACHTAGQDAVVASETIDRNACFNCHKEGVKFMVRPSPKVHLYHQGNRSILPDIGSDYIDRHKENPGSCEDCHIWIEGKTPDCRRCHVVGSHIERNRNNECLSCHKSINDLFKHPLIRETLQTHDVFGNSSCIMCHSPDKIGLQMANGVSVPITAPSRLCKQCHFQIYNEWSNKKHFVVAECTICHNPHSPRVTMSDLNITTEKVAKDAVIEKKKRDSSDGNPDIGTIPKKKKSYYEQEQNK